MEKGRLEGEDVFTSYTEGEWIDKKTFVQYYGEEIRKFTDVSEITGEKLEKLLEENGWEEDGTKFYFSPAVYSLTRAEWTDEDKEGEENA